MKAKHLGSFIVSFMLSISSFSQTKSQYKPSAKIEKWEKVIVKKDFILSNSIWKHRFCKNVWKYQIPEFKKKNPHIIDVDKFEVGDIIDLQLCTDFKFEKADDKLKSDINESFVPVESVAPVKEDPKVSKIEDFESDFTLLFSFGGLAEQDEKTQASFGFRVLAEIQPRIGYRLRLDYAPTVLMWHNELLIQTIPDGGNRYYLAYGLGNRMGLKENADVLLSNKTTGYTTLALGTSFKLGKGNVDFQIGSNFSNYFSPFMSVMASKKLGDTPYTLGGFIDYRSTRSSKEDTSVDRHWTGAGILFTY